MTSEHVRTVPREHKTAAGDRDGVVHLSSLPSLASPGMTAADRRDPFFDLPRNAEHLAWRDASTARKWQADGRGRIPTALARTRDEALDALIEAPDLVQRIRLLGVLHSWRTCSLEQAAALTGHAALRSPTNTAVSTLFAAGLAELGNDVSGMRAKTLLSEAALLRPTRTDTYDRLVLDRLTWPESIAVTGGQPWATTANHSLHNVLSTELALRLAEYADTVGAVFGERFSTVDLLAGSGVGWREIVGDQRAADATIVRTDGLRIALEMTRSVSARFEAKVMRWARLLEERPLDRSGLCVVFVVANDDVLPRVRAAVAKATRQHPGSVRDRVAERIGVVAWADLFPGRHLVDEEAFLGLRVDRPTGRGPDPWEPCSMLDPVDRLFQPRDPDAIRAVISNSALLGQTPHFLAQRESPTPLWHLLGDGAAPRVPTPPPSRDSRPRKLAVGAGRGVSGPATVPPRLRNIWS